VQANSSAHVGSVTEGKFCGLEIGPATGCAVAVGAFDGGSGTTAGDEVGESLTVPSGAELGWWKTIVLGIDSGTALDIGVATGCAIGCCVGD
jgi:hypothetical protein